MTFTPLHHVLRIFRRDLSTMIVIVTTLSLGTGGTTAKFSVVDAVLLHAVPYAAANQLREVWSRQTPAARVFQDSKGTNSGRFRISETYSRRWKATRDRPPAVMSIAALRCYERAL